MEPTLVTFFCVGFFGQMLAVVVRLRPILALTQTLFRALGPRADALRDYLDLPAF
jgi:hypothetical protein